MELKKLIFVLLILSYFGNAQQDTEVYLADIATVDGKLQLTNPRNISNNQGYDNQPSFYDTNSILFASTRDGQTDILKFNIVEGSTSNWLSDTPTGGEYSPLRIPGKNTISAIRLDLDGLQRLYEYNSQDGSSTVLLKGAKIGYHVWYTPETLVATLLVDNRMDLIICHLDENGKYNTIQKNVGRSLLNIPNTELISYISKENSENWELKSIDPITGETKKLIDIKKTEDICWLPDGTLLAGMGKALYKFHPKNDENWSLLQNFTDKNINNISRLAVNSDATRLAFVAEPSSANIVQKQVESFNTENLDAFAACYSEDVVVRNFPNDTLYSGNETLKANYKRFFENSPKTTVEVAKRIQIGNVVIDEEIVKRSGRTNRQAAIYELTNGKISSMTFVHEKEVVPNIEKIIEENLKAYRARDIEAFLSSYSDDVEVVVLGSDWGYTGIDKMRLQYTDFFKNSKGLSCKIKNRMVLGNIVIDEEHLSINEEKHVAVAIYQIEGGTISRVTFIQ